MPFTVRPVRPTSGWEFRCRGPCGIVSIVPWADIKPGECGQSWIVFPAPRYRLRSQILDLATWLRLHAQPGDDPPWDILRRNLAGRHPRAFRQAEEVYMLDCLKGAEDAI